MESQKILKTLRRFSQPVQRPPQSPHHPFCSVFWWCLHQDLVPLLHWRVHDCHAEVCRRDGVSEKSCCGQQDAHGLCAWSVREEVTLFGIIELFHQESASYATTLLTMAPTCFPTQPSLSKRSPSSPSKYTSRNSAKVGSVSHGACSSAPGGTIFTHPSFAGGSLIRATISPVLLTLELVSLLSSTCTMEMRLGSYRWVVGVC